MGATKHEAFSDNENDISRLLKALGHPARVAIIEYLLTTNDCICDDIVKKLPLAQPTVSQHLRELKSSGIIKGSIEGNTICYCIDITALEKIQVFINKIFEKTACQNSSCC